MWLDKYLKRPVSEHPSTVNIVKGSQTLVKSAWEQFYDIFSSLWGKLIWKMFLLVIWDILGLFVKILIADDKYPFRNC